MFTFQFTGNRQCVSHLWNLIHKNFKLRKKNHQDGSRVQRNFSRHAFEASWTQFLFQDARHHRGDQTISKKASTYPGLNCCSGPGSCRWWNLHVSQWWETALVQLSQHLGCQWNLYARIRNKIKIMFTVLSFHCHRNKLQITEKSLNFLIHIINTLMTPWYNFFGMFKTIIL